MSMHWKPETKAVVMGKSRIRRDPVKLVADVPSARRAQRRLTKQEEMWFGITGVLLFAAVIVVAVVGIAIATYSKLDPAAAAQEARFGQCYNGGTNCVIDGDTIYVGGTRVTIAGMEAPLILGAQCDAERNRGIDAAVQLVNLLNSGDVTMSGTFHDEFGRDVRKVSVKGRNVATMMIDSGLARFTGSKTRPWC